MLRWMTPFLVAILAAGTAAAAEDPAAKAPDAPAAATSAEPPATAKPNDEPPAAKPPENPAPGKSASSPAPAKRAGNSAARRAARQLPSGLPRAQYNYRTTVTPAKAPLYVRRGRAVVVEEEILDLPLISGGIKPYAPRIFGTPLLPGSSTLPGYYGTTHSYSYDGPYYGSPSYWNRLPYACGVYGYC